MGHLGKGGKKKEGTNLETSGRRGCRNAAGEAALFIKGFYVFKGNEGMKEGSTERTN